MYLMEGGRWLLLAADTGSITYFDLDASTPTETILIPDQFDPLLSAESSAFSDIHYFSIPETTSLPPVDFTDATAMPLWRERGLGIDLGLRSSSISKPFVCSDSIRFSIRGRDTVHGVIIGYPYNEGPSEPLGRTVKLVETLNWPCWDLSIQLLMAG
ncbi:hypothetical protein M413DRAFT_285781 [Hebeloma cylindrosporum]|uniref:Uncharacterized protein n=1 Tax=Hebeloma cylindrosporum TaxID=76867 RepID=A0A0C3BIW2_HEBCY|nr:hypothetical protein M413DRAFT_285781 [Hebeloma cylindrosporum h7]